MDMKRMKSLIIATLACALVMAMVGIAVMTLSSGKAPEEKNAEYYVTRGDAYYESGEYSMALACYTKAIGVDETDIAARHGEARCNSAMNYLEEAVSSYEALAEFCPEDAEIQLEYVNSMIAAGQLDTAKATLETLLRTFEDERMVQLYANMNPSAPTADLQSGTYDSYQLLNLTSENKDAAIYYTLDGSDPTLYSQLYTGRLVISAPDTVLRVSCINYLGYSSEILELHYTVTVPVETIMDRDYTAFGQAVRTALNKSYDQPIYNYEVAQITSLYVIGDGYYEDSENGIFYNNSYTFPNYGNRYVYRGDGNQTSLKYLPFLDTLAICWQSRVSLDAIKDLKYLKHLSLLNNNIRDIKPLAQLTGLETLALGWNYIKDITPLEGMTELTSLGLWNNNLEDISAVSRLQKLQYLDVANNQLTSLEPAAQLPALHELWANGNQITSMGALDPNGTLEILMMSGNPLTDYSQWREAHPNLTRTDISE